MTQKPELCVLKKKKEKQKPKKPNQNPKQQILDFLVPY